MLDAGLDLGKTPAQSAVLLRETRGARRARLPAAAVGVEQALHRRAARPRDRRPARGVAGRGRVRRHARVPHRARARRRADPRGCAACSKPCSTRPSWHARDDALSCKAPIPACAIARCSGSSTSCSAPSDRSLALEDHTIAVAGGAACGDDDADAGTRRRRHVDRAAGVRRGHERVAEPAVHDRVPRRGGARHRQPHDGSGEVAGGVDRRPLDGVHLVLVAGGGRTPPSLDKARQGARRRSSRPRPSRPPACSQRELKDAGVQLAPDASARLVEHLGDDAGRVPELVELLAVDLRQRRRRSTSTMSRRTSVSVGTAGRFDLANAIDRGDVGDRARGAAPPAHRDERRADRSRCTRCR